MGKLEKENPVTALIDLSDRIFIRYKDRVFDIPVVNLGDKDKVYDEVTQKILKALKHLDGEENDECVIFILFLNGEKVVQYLCGKFVHHFVRLVKYFREDFFPEGGA